MISRLRESLALILIALLPLHALLVTVLTKFILGPLHAPLAIIALWKEAVLGVILILGCFEMVLCAREKKSVAGIRWSIDAIDVCIFLGIFYAFVLEFTTHYSLLTFHSSFLLGFKYDFIPLVSFLVLRRVPWSEWFRSTTLRVLLVVSGLVSLYGIVSYFLPMSFFTWLGYSDLHSLYQADSPLAAFQQIGGTSIRRMQSTMSGPNQLGIWLLIPLGLVLSESVRRKVVGGRWSVISFIFIILAALALTFSRAAWVGAFIMTLVAFFMHTLMTRRTKAWVVGSFSLLMTTCVIITSLMFPTLVLRLQSSSDHLKKPVEAIRMIADNPYGFGLGSAGPASNRFSDTCVKLAANADVSWAVDRPNLCVFVDGTQIQPQGRACSCPILTENWYLQWGVEMGILGLVLSVMLVFLVLRKWKVATSHPPVFLAFLGISIAALFLHAWEDAAVAYTVWLLMSCVLLTRNECS